MCEHCLTQKVCPRCHCDVEDVFPAKCSEQPEKLADMPIGQYHCPDCGTLVMAGINHPGLCRACNER